MKSSDLGLTIFIIFIFIALYIFNILAVGIKNVQENWAEYRCNPMVMPFTSMIGPKGETASENFTKCVQNMQKNYMQFLLLPVNYNLAVMGNNTGGLIDSVNSSRAFMDKFRNMVGDSFGGIYNVVLNISTVFQKLTINLKDLFGKLIGILAAMLYILDGSIKTMESGWNGPPGKAVRYVGSVGSKLKCFHPDTKIKLKDKTIIRMEDVKLGDILENNSEVVGTMKLHNLDSNNERIQKFHKIAGGVNNEYVYVTGEHLIYNPHLMDFQHVKDFPNVIETDDSSDYFICLITTNHIIQIGSLIFHDWEDNNGSPSKDV